MNIKAVYSSYFHILSLAAACELSQRQIVERREKAVEVGKMKGELQKEEETQHQSEGNKASLSGSMMPIDVTMSNSNDPDHIGGDQSYEEFVMLSLPPKFVPRHFEDLEDALRCTYGQTGDTKDNSFEDSDGDNSEVSNKNKHDSSSDHSDNQSHDDAHNDVYRVVYEKFQEEEMSSSYIHHHNVKTQLELSSTKNSERSGKTSEMKEEKEEEHKV